MNGQEHWIQPLQKWQDMELEEPIKEIQIDPDFYVGSLHVLEAETVK